MEINSVKAGTGAFSYLSGMPAARQLVLRPATCDILDNNGEGVAIAYRLADGRWNFRDLEKDWWEESSGPLEMDQLLDAFIEMRRVRGQDERAGKASPGKVK